MFVQYENTSNREAVHEQMIEMEGKLQFSKIKSPSGYTPLHTAKFAVQLMLLV